MNVAVLAAKPTGLLCKNGWPDPGFTGSNGRIRVLSDPWIRTRPIRTQNGDFDNRPTCLR
jgi:hypothetical protein